MRNLIILLVSIFILVGSSASAQEEAIKETTDKINKLLDGRAVVRFKKEELIVEVFKNGKIFRRDKAYVDDLNADATAYIADEWSIVLRCKERARDCVDKELFVHKKHNQYTRLTVLIKGNEEIKDDLIANFAKLIKLYQE